MKLFLNLALMAWMSVSTLAQDFDWDISPEPDFATIAFNDATENNEAVFNYNYTGTYDANSKYFVAQVRQKDCLGAAGPGVALMPFAPDTANNELTLNVDVDQADMTADPLHYLEASDGLSATIEFCVRVDYMYNDGVAEESINFHETKVTISVDLTAGFTLTAITARDAADEEAANAALDYPVIAYICDELGAEITNPAALAQGSILQFCVKMDDSVTADVFVENILAATLSQPLGTGATRSIISGTNPTSPLTAMQCDYDGICNIRNQLASDYFQEALPKPLRVDGTAILSFGVPTARPTGGRRLRVPIRGLVSAEQVQALMDSQRRLQQEGGEAPFDLEVGLNGQGVPAVQGTLDKEGSNNTIVIAAIVLVLSILVAVGIFCFCRRRTAVEEKQVQVAQYNGSVAYPSNNVNVSFRPSQPQITSQPAL